MASRTITGPAAQSVYSGSPFFIGATSVNEEEPKTLDDVLKLACKHEMVETAQKHLQMLRQKEVVASTEV